MEKQIFLNMSVKNLNKSKDFFSKLNFEFNTEYTNETAACMVLGKNIYVMLLTEALFKTFTNKEICDTKKSTEVLIGINAESRERVKEMVKIAAASGGKNLNKPQDHGFMYQEAFEDLDGHTWEIIYMQAGT